MFRCSDAFVRRWFHVDLNWSIRRGTRAAQKVPKDVEDQGLHMHLRLTSLIPDHDIPAEFIVNLDQTQVVYEAGSKSTWEGKGSKQVNVVGLEEKRAFTLTPVISAAGAIVAFHATYQGKTKESLPRRTTANSASYDFMVQTKAFACYPSGTKTYWQNQRLMKVLIADIAAYFEAQAVAMGRPKHSRCVIILDVWSVHRSREFRDFMTLEYPWISLVYVPANCTSRFQPLDAGTQRIMKLAMKRVAHADTVGETLEAFESGKTAGEVVLDGSLPNVRNRSLGWLVAGYQSLTTHILLKVRCSFRLFLVSLLIHHLNSPMSCA